MLVPLGLSTFYVYTYAVFEFDNILNWKWYIYMFAAYGMVGFKVAITGSVANFIEPFKFLPSPHDAWHNGHSW